jgi:hypothetical protein
MRAGLGCWTCSRCRTRILLNYSMIVGDLYEFVCNACKKTFAKILTIAQHDKEKPPIRIAVVTT